MAENLDRRFGDMLVVECRACFSEILQLPGLILARFNILPRLDAREVTEFREAVVWPRSTPKDYRIVGRRIYRRNAPQVGMNNPVHRPVERLAGLHAPIIQ